MLWLPVEDFLQFTKYAEDAKWQKKRKCQEKENEGLVAELEELTGRKRMIKDVG